ncbi:hypothetical protein GTP81_22585 [Rugamonas sp. FT107W]|uniref:Uncharacterized protein n=1 Tax=Duganella vulcania TaxID=2692166 RepID=A0A845HRQ3_9BURK|nr:hypothetical protein [Duganella vulcania]MYN19534.1 hypothetical protein [Duganella vulcania]
MRKYSFRTQISLLFLCLAAARGALAAEPWQQLETQLHRNAGLVGNEIATSFELPGDDAPDTGAYRTHILRGEKDGTPARSAPEDAGAAKKSVLALGIAERFANHPEQLLQAPEAIVPLGATTIGQRALSLYEVRSRFPNGKAPVTAKIWLDPASGELLKVAGAVTGIPMPGVKTVYFTVLYRADGEGRSLPATLTVDYTVSMFFHTGKIHFAQEFANWDKRP